MKRTELTDEGMYDAVKIIEEFKRQYRHLITERVEQEDGTVGYKQIPYDPLLLVAFTRAFVMEKEKNKK